MLVSLCSGSHNTSPRNQTNTLVLKPSGMQLQAGSRQRGLPATGRGRAAAHPLRAPLRARVAKLCAVDSSQLVVGYTTPDQYFAVAGVHRHEGKREPGSIAIAQAFGPLGLWACVRKVCPDLSNIAPRRPCCLLHLQTCTPPASTSPANRPMTAPGTCLTGSGACRSMPALQGGGQAGAPETLVCSASCLFACI